MEFEFEYIYYLNEVSNSDLKLEEVPFEFRDLKMCMASISRNENIIINVDESQSKPDWYVYRDAIPDEYDAIPDILKTPDNIIEMLKINGLILKKIPDEMKTFEMCKIATENNCNAVKYIPRCMYVWRPELIDAWIRAIDKDISMIQYMPKHLITSDICLAMIKKNIDGLLYIPDECITPEICEYAVEHDCNALELIPLRFMTRDLCFKAVSKFSDALRLVPPEFVDLDMINTVYNIKETCLPQTPLKKFRRN